MTSKVQPYPRPPNTSNSRSPDVQGARTLANFLAQHGAIHRDAANFQDESSKYPVTPHETRNDPQSRGSYNPREGVRIRETNSYSLPHQSVPAASRRHHTHPSQSLESPTMSHNPPQRHPSLSLDTRNLHNSHPSHSSPFPHPSVASPAAVEINTPLYTDLTTLKTGLETLWNFSSKKLSALHATLNSQAETIRALSITNSRLESTVAQQQGVLMQENEKLSSDNIRIIKEVQEAEEGRRKALREREMLSVANARLWEDKARLEGEKRELRAKLDASADAAQMYQREVEKGKKSPKAGVKVKMEEDDANFAENEDAGIRVSLAQLEEFIEKRLHSQAAEFTREANELYGRLAQSQTQVTELESQLERYNATTGLAVASPYISSRAPSHPSQSHEGKNGHRNVNGGAQISPPPGSPVTPHTALPSSVSETEREYPFVKAWGSRRHLESIHHANAASSSVPQESRRPSAALTGPRMSHGSQRTVSGPVESDRPTESVTHRSRVSVPTQDKTVPQRSISHSISPIMDPMHPGRSEAAHSRGRREVYEQTVSTYGGIGAGWKPAAPPHLETTHSLPRAPHSRPPTPDRPPKRARTNDPQEAVEKQQGDIADVQMASNSPASPCSPDEEQSARDMTADERLMFPSLSRVLTKKRDGDGWKCVLCKQEKKSPTATFSETTPIGVVTQHVKDTHRQFWKDLKEGGSRAPVSEL